MQPWKISEFNVCSSLKTFRFVNESDPFYCFTVLSTIETDFRPDHLYVVSTDGKSTRFAKILAIFIRAA